MPSSSSSPSSGSGRRHSASSSSQSALSPTSRHDFQVIKELGKGAFAKVYKVKRLADNRYYALKKVDVGKMKRKEVQDAFNEIRILCTFGKNHAHPRLVRMYETYMDKNQTELNIVMEFCACGDLSEKVERYKQRRTYIDERVIWVYLIQITEGLKGLHQLGILHRDLKAANCFLAEDGSIKIGDMNVSKVTQQENLAQTQIGTPYYMAPEIWKCRPYGEGVDIWALGCLIFELCSLRPPFLAQSLPELKSKVLTGKYPRIPKTYCDELQRVISKFLDVDPDKRPSAQEILNMEEVNKRKTLVKNAMTTEWVPPPYIHQSLRLARGGGDLSSQHITLPQLPPSQYDDDSDEDSNDEEEESKRERNGGKGISSTSSTSTSVPQDYYRDHSGRRASVGKVNLMNEEKEGDEEGKEDQERRPRNRKSTIPNDVGNPSGESSQPRRESTGTPRRASIVPCTETNITRDERRTSIQTPSYLDEGLENGKIERKNSLTNVVSNAMAYFPNMIKNGGRSRASSVENNNVRRSSKVSVPPTEIVSGADGGRRGSTSDRRKSSSFIER